jgi:hypothetical protein
MKFAILGLLLVLLIGFFVVVWKAAKDWRWYNIVAVCITMLLAIAFLFPTAGVLRSRSAWHQIKEQLEVQAAQVEAEYRTIKYGDPANPETGEGLILLDQQLSKLGIEAGRRWRGLQRRTVANDSITLVKPEAEIPADIPVDVPVAPPAAATAADPAAAAAAPAAPEPAAPQPLIPDAMVVYAFAEAPDNQQRMVPFRYLGEFRVNAPTPTQVTLTPTGSLEQDQLQVINNPQFSSWSLYELLPLDGHEPFIAVGSQPSDDNVLGRVDDEAVRRLLGKVSEQTLNDYLRDGSRLLPDDPPLSRWINVEFTRNHSIDVDSTQQSGVLEGGFFDESGRAVDARLQHGEEGLIAFKQGDQVLLKEEAADQLIDEGIAKLMDSYYLRPLNDYRFVLRRIRMRLNDLANRSTQLEFQIQVLQTAVDKTVEMIVANRVIRDKLEQDRDQYRIEKAAIESYAAELRQRVQETRAAMLQLHQQNLELEQKLEQSHLEIERRLNAITMTP